MSKSLKPSSIDAIDVRVATGPLVLSGLRAELVSAEGRAGGLPIEAGGVRADRHVPLLLCPVGAFRGKVAGVSITNGTAKATFSAS